MERNSVRQVGPLVFEHWGLHGGTRYVVSGGRVSLAMNVLRSGVIRSVTLELVRERHN